MDDISASLEDYLEMIFILHRKGGEAGLLEHEFYGTIALTPEGETRAAQVLRRHRMIRHFLHHTLGVPEEIAEEDACRMEHVVSAQTIQHLYDYLSRQEDGYEE